MPSELEALQAAAFLHDIGKLAVPEHIISKPGRLTAEEFEKMKIHPSSARRSWSASNFPIRWFRSCGRITKSGMAADIRTVCKGEEIPIGARILAAVDCLDALASDRQYRRALPLDEAMKVVYPNPGPRTIPRWWRCSERYLELDDKALAQTHGKKLSKDVKIGAGMLRPPASNPRNAGARQIRPTDFLKSIAAARQEVRQLFEMSQDLGNSLSLNETLSVLAVRLKRIVPHDSIAIWVRARRFWCRSM